MAPRLSIVLVFLALCVNMNMNDAALYNKSHVVIKNVLQNNKMLKIHCQSKDDDLGFHVISVGQTYEFSFRDNVGFKTLFWCNLWQGPNFKHHQVFDAYKSLGSWQWTWVWEAREDGIYFYNDKTAIYKYGWDAPHSVVSTDDQLDYELNHN